MELASDRAYSADTPVFATKATVVILLPCPTAHIAHEPVEERDNHDVGFAGLHHLDRAAQTWTLRRRCTTRHIERVGRLDKVQPIAVACLRDAVALIARGNKLLA